MAFNETFLHNMSNVSGVSSLAVKVNGEVGGWLGISMWLTIIVTLFMSMKLRGIETTDSFMACAFAGFIISIFLRGMELLPDWFMIISTVLLAVSVVFGVISKSG